MLRTAWPRTPVDDIDMMVNVYHLGLRTVDYADAEQAVADCIETCTFLPTVAEIRERIPKKHVLDAELYNRFHELLEIPNRTVDEQRDFANVCRRLGISYMATARGPIDVEAVPAKVTPMRKAVTA